MAMKRFTQRKEISRSPHGERGLKCNVCSITPCGVLGRSPHGERGLKFFPKNRKELYQFVALLTESVD